MGTFLYFSYGSNLLQKRIYINNPSAKRIGIGKLLNYQLDFNTYSKRWQGCSATIVKNTRRHVWGAIWEIGLEHKDDLDSQEGVKQNIYFVLEVDVVLPNGETKKCRVYEQCNSCEPTQRIEDVIAERKPSGVYLNTILEGAAESELPEEYQEFLKRIPHNGYMGAIDITTQLHLK